MANADFVFNIAKGRVVQFFMNVDNSSPANSRIVVIPLEYTNLEDDETLKDYDTVQAMLAGTTNRQTTMNDKTLGAANVSYNVDDALGANRVDVDCDDVEWLSATGNQVGALVFAYDADYTTGSDADLIPLTKHAFVVTPDGTNIKAQINAAGLFRAS